MPLFSIALPAVIGAGASFLGDRAQANAISDAARASQATIQPFTLNQPGGGFSIFDPLNQRITNSLGPGLDQSQGLLSNFANQILTGLPNAGNLPFDLTQAAGNAGTLSRDLSNQLGLLGGNVQNQLLPGVLDELGIRFADANRSQEDVRSNTLDLLRSQSADFETRQAQQLQERLFGQGILGASAGALQSEAFFDSLRRSDLDRQLAAQQVADQQRTLNNNLLQAAFGRFGQTSGLLRDIGTSRIGLADQDVGRQANLLGLQNTLRNDQLGLALNALGGQGALNQQALQNFQAALAAAQAQGNIAIGAGSNLAGFAQNPNFGANPLSGLGAAIGNNAGSISDFLQNTFGNAGTPPIRPSDFIPGSSTFVGPPAPDNDPQFVGPPRT